MLAAYREGKRAFDTAAFVRAMEDDNEARAFQVAVDALYAIDAELEVRLPKAIYDALVAAGTAEATSATRRGGFEIATEPDDTIIETDYEVIVKFVMLLLLYHNFHHYQP